MREMTNKIQHLEERHMKDELSVKKLEETDKQV